MPAYMYLSVVLMSSAQKCNDNRVPSIPTGSTTVASVWHKTSPAMDTLPR